MAGLPNTQMYILNFWYTDVQINIQVNVELFAYIHDVNVVSPGMLSVVSALDYEVTKQYNLTVEVSDVKTRATATTVVTIIVKVTHCF